MSDKEIFGRGILGAIVMVGGVVMMALGSNELRSQTLKLASRLPEK